MKARRLRIAEDTVDLTPMIDIVFLLLIYFMVTTTIVKEEADLGVKLPSSMAAPPNTPLPEQHYIDILIDGTVMLNGMPTDNPGDYTLPNLTRTLMQLKLSSDRAGLKTLVIIQPDPEAYQQSVVNVINALNEIKWREKGKTISVRINSLDTHYMYSDLVEIVEQAGENVDTILVPKAGTASDVYMVDCLLTQIETNKKLKNKIGIECLIETALGMSNIKEIAKSSERLEALHFGVADYAASLRARTVVIGGLNPDYPGDQWHHGLSELVMTCRAYGLRAIDGPFGDFNDPDAYIAAAKRGAAIGIEGKWAIHPSQIELANKVFSPPEAEVNKAKRILEELEKAAKEGKGAAQLDGRMIDAASARMAENIVNIDKLINNK